jgi:hypothetical protein
MPNIAKKAVANKVERIVIAQQAPRPVRVPDGEYLAQFVGPTRFARSGKAIVQETWLKKPDVMVPLYANLPKDGVITPRSKIGQILAALGVPAAEEFCNTTLEDRRCWVLVKTSTYTIAYDGDLKGRTPGDAGMPLRPIEGRRGEGGGRN